MANPSGPSLFTTFSELVSTTFRNHKKSFADNVTTHNALWRRLSDKGRIRLEDGGLSIVMPLEYATNSTLAAIQNLCACALGIIWRVGPLSSRG